MTQVDFYILEQPGTAALLQVICRLAEKAFNVHKKTYIQTANAELSTAIDEHLWVFKDISFIPHQHLTQATTPIDPSVEIIIGEIAAPAFDAEILLNLTGQVPADFSRYQRILELVPADVTERDSARERYRFYQTQQCAVAKHNLS